MKFFGNNTIALIFLGVIAIVALLFNQKDIASVAIGAIGGFIGSEALKAKEETK